MKYATIKECDVANGPGIRVSLFVSGCNHHCKGCFNREAWDFNYGNEFTKDTEEKIIKAMEPSHIKGLSLLGGEPLETVNQKGLVSLVKKVKETYPNKDIWCYTGFLFDKDVMGKMFSENEDTKELMQCIDYVVDGKFQEELKNPSLQFRGSSNQRIIDVKDSLQEKRVSLWKGLKDNSKAV